MLDAVMENRILSEEAMKASLIMNYEEHLKNEEIAWRQRSRTLWLKEGDKNANYFHKMANAYKRCNNIDQMIIQDERLKDPQN